MTSSGCTLLVRHLPAELDDAEKVDFLTHFGAQKVKLMGCSGPMKHAVFAMFENPKAAERCLKTLHQIDLLGCKLVVEFAKADIEKELKHTVVHKKDAKVENETDDTVKPDVVTEKERLDNDNVFQKHNIDYPRKSNLFYLYPPPTVATLTNIANALASHPRFYTQVLHLMNKMNLPCPFGAVTATPPLALDVTTNRGAERKMHGVEIKGEDIDECEMEQSSTEESEIDSDPESKTGNAAAVPSQTRKMLKRPRKRMRLVEPDASMVTKPLISVKPTEVFENAEAVKPTQIVFNLSEQAKGNTLPNPPEPSNVEVIEGGFGKVQPVVKPKETTETIKEDVNYQIIPKDFMSKDEVRSGKLKPNQMKEFSVFKNYSAGDPTCRIYIKNLTKKSTEQDLVNLFGSYVDWSSANVNDVFDIRLMKEGRMKGQAFVTLPDEESAKKIVSECTGFVMNGKPVVIQFARSAKAKEVKELIS